MGTHLSNRLRIVHAFTLSAKVQCNNSLRICSSFTFWLRYNVLKSPNWALVVGIAKQIPRNWYGCRLWWFRMLKTGLRLEHTNEHPWDQALPRQQALIPVWAGGHYVLSACCVPYSPSLRPFSSLEGLLEGLQVLASTQHIVGYHNGSRGWSPCLCLGTRICVNGKQDLTRS